MKAEVSEVFSGDTRQFVSIRCDSPARSLIRGGGADEGRFRYSSHAHAAHKDGTEVVGQEGRITWVGGRSTSLILPSRLPSFLLPSLIGLAFQSGKTDDVY